VQARSQRTYERILAAATELLEQDGLPGLTTNAVAERAGVNIATLYSYFADKTAILRELATRFEQLRNDYFLGQLALFVARDDWRAWVHETLRTVVDYRVQEPGSFALRRAVASMPELADIDREISREAARRGAPYLEARSPGLTRHHAELIVMLASDTATQMFDIACADGPPDPAHVDEIEAMLIAYLALYLDPPRGIPAPNGPQAHRAAGPAAPTASAADS